MPLFIGVDSGTQSTKAVVLDLDYRRVIAEARAPHALIAGLPPGHAEQHPADWTAALDSVSGVSWPGASTRGRCAASGSPGSSTVSFPSMPPAR